MKIALFGKNLTENNVEYVQLLVDKIAALGISMVIYEAFYNTINKSIRFSENVQTFSSHIEIKKDVDFLLSIGGDGTLLDTITLVRDSGVPILGINLGRLGFLASINKEMIIPALNSLLEGNYILDKRTLVSLETPSNPFGEMNYALNEMTVYKQLPLSMIRVKVFVDGEFLNTYWSDGLIISTPTGSTGYSLSCGGPILYPGASSFVITPIAPHNLNVRPMIISDDSVLSFEIEDRSTSFLITLDSRSETIDSKIQLAVRKADFAFNLVRFNNEDYLTTLRTKLMWGLDNRNQ